MNCMNEKIMISVIVPCYNQAQNLDECLQSVLDQTYPDWECLIVDDGSPDKTEEIARQWIKKDSRFRYLKKENGGLSSARNAGIKEAIGQWILPLDADDKIDVHYMEIAEKEFEKNYSVIYCQAQKFGNENGAWILPEYNMENLAIGNMIFCTSFFRKTDWFEIGGFDESLLTGWEDWDFWISLLKKNKKVLKLNRVCFYYRIKDNSMLTTLFNEKGKEKKRTTLRYIILKHIDFFVDYIVDFHQIKEQNRDLKTELNDIKNSRSYKLAQRLSNWYKIFH